MVDVDVVDDDVVVTVEVVVVGLAVAVEEVDVGLAVVGEGDEGVFVVEGVDVAD